MGRKLNTDAFADRAGITAGTAKYWRFVGRGPTFIKLGEAKQAGVVYDEDDVEAWLQARKFASTSAYSPAARKEVKS